MDRSLQPPTIQGDTGGRKELNSANNGNMLSANGRPTGLSSSRPGVPAAFGPLPSLPTTSIAAAASALMSGAAGSASSGYPGDLEQQRRAMLEAKFMCELTAQSLSQRIESRRSELVTLGGDAELTLGGHRAARQGMLASATGIDERGVLCSGRSKGDAGAQNGTVRSSYQAHLLDPPQMMSTPLASASEVLRYFQGEPRFLGLANLFQTRGLCLLSPTVDRPQNASHNLEAVGRQLSSAGKPDDHIYNEDHGDENDVADDDPEARRPKNCGGVTELFPHKLHRMLEESEKDELQDIVSFFPHGKSFCIHKPSRFVTDVMPKYFKGTRITSFQRQLNLYGFRRINYGPEHGGYFHQYFIKGRPEFCHRIKRVPIKGAEAISKSGGTQSGHEPDDGRHYITPFSTVDPSFVAHNVADLMRRNFQVPVIRNTAQSSGLPELREQHPSPKPADNFTMQSLFGCASDQRIPFTHLDSAVAARARMAMEAGALEQLRSVNLSAGAATALAEFVSSRQQRLTYPVGQQPFNVNNNNIHSQEASILSFNNLLLQLNAALAGQSSRSNGGAVALSSIFDQAQNAQIPRPPPGGSNFDYETRAKDR